MAYRVWVGNVAIDCDSAEEAIDLAKRVEGESTPASRSVGKHPDQELLQTGFARSEGSRWTEKRVTDFFRLIEGKQRRLIDVLLEHPDGRTDEQLRQHLNVESGKGLAGVFTGMWKNAKKVGADPDDLYNKRAVTIGGKRAYEYFLSESFRKAAQTVKL